MDDKTLTDTEMMIFAISFQARRKTLENNASLKEEQKVFTAYQNAVNDAISIRENYAYLKNKLSDFESNKIDREVLRKIVGLPPEE